MLGSRFARAVVKTASPSMVGLVSAPRNRYFVNERLLRQLSTKIVSVEEARKMPKSYNQMPNDILLTMAVGGDQEAREERLIRDIMSTDNIEWAKAHEVLHKIKKSNRKGLFLITLPYKIGVASAVFAGVASIPLIFDLDTVLYFNEHYVTTDVPEDKDLETPLEVASWAWNWMEPPLGQISFFLLCMQFARAQLANLGAKPFTGWYKAHRARRLVREYPQYDEIVLESFSEGDSFTPAPLERF